MKSCPFTILDIGEIADVTRILSNMLIKLIEHVETFNGKSSGDSCTYEYVILVLSSPKVN